MKLLTAVLVSSFSASAFAAKFDCHFAVNDDFGHGKSFVFDGENQIEVEVGAFKSSTKVVNVGTENVPDLRLQLRLIKGEDHAAALFMINEEHPFLSTRINGETAQVQCWIKK